MPDNCCTGCPALDADRPWFGTRPDGRPDPKLRRGSCCPLASRGTVIVCAHRARYERQRPEWQKGREE